LKEDYQKWKNEMRGVLRAEDITGAVLYAFDQSLHVCVRAVAVAATGQEP